MGIDRNARRRASRGVCHLTVAHTSVYHCCMPLPATPGAMIGSMSSRASSIPRLTSKNRSPSRGRAVPSRGTTPLCRALTGRGLNHSALGRVRPDNGGHRRRLPRAPSAARDAAPRPSSLAVTGRLSTTRGSLDRSRQVLSSSPPLRHSVVTFSAYTREGPLSSPSTAGNELGHATRPTALHRSPRSALAMGWDAQVLAGHSCSHPHWASALNDTLSSFTEQQPQMSRHAAVCPPRRRSPDHVTQPKNQRPTNTDVWLADNP
ncbi:hypothetical protein HRbin28_01768 [bacterium HR28]|nr:hypothetical protein HRbin28_01768 [bacterium HR28]